jgi:hypothetical protein
VWDAAQQNSVTRLMPLAEANSNLTLYRFLQMLTEQDNAAWNAINDAQRFSILDPDPTHLSLQQLADNVQLTEIAIEKHLQVGLSIALISSLNPDLPASLNYDEIRSYRRSSYQQDPQGMAAAHQRTMDRLKVAGYVPQDDELTTVTKAGK